MGAFEEITKNSKRKHAHNTNQPKCSRCGSFVAVDIGDKKGVYICDECGKPGMVWSD